MAVVQGIIHGRIIELDQAPNLPDGQAVSVTVQPTIAVTGGLRRAFGAWRDDADSLQAFLDDVRIGRRAERPEAGE